MNDEQTNPVLRSKQKSWLLGLAFAIGLIALGLSLSEAIYFYYHASSWQASFSASAQKQSDMQRTLKHNKRDIHTLSETIATLTADNQHSAQTFTQLQTQVTTLQNTLQTQLSKPALPHVLYLLQLADDALLYQFDSNQAIIYLQAAHNELTTSNQAELQALDTALQQTLTTLRTTSPLNIAKMINQLSELQDTVNTLPLTQTEPKNNTVAHDNNTSFWHNLSSNAWHGLQKVITVKHYGSNAPHFITPDERAYLNTRLCLYLSQAQWATLNHNTVLFKQSIHSAQNWLQTHYDTNNATAQTMLKQLTQLSAINLQPDFPELSPLIERVQHTLIHNGE